MTRLTWALYGLQRFRVVLVTRLVPSGLNTVESLLESELSLAAVKFEGKV